MKVKKGNSKVAGESPRTMYGNSGLDSSLSDLGFTDFENSKLQ
jgi:hypothetical protein